MLSQEETITLFTLTIVKPQTSVMVCVEFGKKMGRPIRVELYQHDLTQTII